MNPRVPIVPMCLPKAKISAFPKTPTDSKLVNQLIKEKVCPSKMKSLFKDQVSLQRVSIAHKTIQK